MGTADPDAELLPRGGFENVPFPPRFLRFEQGGPEPWDLWMRDAIHAAWYPMPGRIISLRKESLSSSLPLSHVHPFQKSSRGLWGSETEQGTVQRR